MNANKNKNYKLRTEVLNLYTKIDFMENTPLLIYGTLRFTHKDGTNETKTKTAVFCRCGLSSNKPYCDGAYVNGDFKG